VLVLVSGLEGAFPAVVVSNVFCGSGDFILTVFGDDGRELPSDTWSEGDRADGKGEGGRA
jgi:hypothetical protein